MSSPAVHVDLTKVVLISNASRSTLRLVFPVKIKRDVRGAIGKEGALATGNNRIGNQSRINLMISLSLSACSFPSHRYV
jgi:hypothetical protein